MRVSKETFSKEKENGKGKKVGKWEKKTNKFKIKIVWLKINKKRNSVKIDFLN